ncbi:hypothetical protein AB0M46_11980 [Dactylosporangium sp. NPDC051485]|uniref:hypothetical protein n=1 Tax=Dactylosporangium sp. NPDC051485 TaxID=3154846 RepID=UPI003422BA29
MQEVDLHDLLAEPAAYFGNSYTAMHSIERESMLDMQRRGLALRFAQHVESIPMVARLAGRQGVTAIDDLADVVPLLFEHTMYKSYPISLLARQQFGRLTEWIGKLTSVPVTSVDLTGCTSIDQWLNTVSAQTDIDIFHSSGTSGTMSFFPWSKQDLVRIWSIRRMTHLQVYGEEPDDVLLREPFHYIRTSTRFDRRDLGSEAITFGRPGYTHVATEQRPSADLLWLASRLRLAAAQGDSSRVDVPESLLARRDELRRSRDRDEDTRARWLAEIEQLQGQHVLWTIMPHDLFEIALPHVEQSETWSFSSRSVVHLTGGAKGRSLPPDWMDTLKKFLDVRVLIGYSMSELTDQQVMCSAGRYHLQPWVIPYVLDPDTSALLPRRGVQTGRFAFFNLMTDSHWGGLMTGDEVELDYDGPCACGATTQHLGPDIVRLSEKRGGDDKISCAATPQAHADAMQFLNDF